MRVLYTPLVHAKFTKGQMGILGAYEKSGVRPAFCLSTDTEIEKRKDIVEGKEVFTIKN